MLVIALLLAPALTGLACWLSSGRTRDTLHLTGSLVTLVLGLLVGGPALGGQTVTAAGDLFYLDALGALVLLLVVSIGFAAAVYSVNYLRTDLAENKTTPSQVRWYYLAFHLFAATMIATPLFNNLGLVWVAVEATTLASVLLVGFYRTNIALEAAWKYVVLCTVGLLIALFGVVLTYVAAVRLGVSLNWTEIFAAGGRLDPQVMRTAFVFILLGFGTKAGLAPMHTWLPDAHSQAPSPISALLSAVQLNCALYAIFRFHTLASLSIGKEFSGTLLIAFGLFSVIVSVPFILVQRDLKRLLAYSSVEHMGLIAVAVGVGGTVGLYAAVFHLINHSLTKALLFFVAGDLAQTYRTQRIRRIRGAVTLTPLAGALLVLGVLAITGAPPFSIFLSEFSIVAAAFGQGNIAVGAALILALAFVFAGFLGHLGPMAFGPASAQPSTAGPGRGRLLIVLPGAAAIILFGLWMPPALSGLITNVASILGGQLG